MWAVPIGLQGVMAPHIGYEVGMGGSEAQDPICGIWGVAIGLRWPIALIQDMGWGWETLGVWDPSIGSGLWL